MYVYDGSAFALAIGKARRNHSLSVNGRTVQINDFGRTCMQRADAPLRAPVGTSLRLLWICRVLCESAAVSQTECVFRTSLSKTSSGMKVMGTINTGIFIVDPEVMLMFLNSSPQSCQLVPPRAKRRVLDSCPPHKDALRRSLRV